MADAQDLKSWGLKQPCGFESHHRHHPRKSEARGSRAEGRNFVTTAASCTYPLVEHWNAGFMKRTQLCFLLAGGVVAAGFKCFAGPMRPADVAAEPAWVVHVDCDNLRATD